ncbi:hypothetical protein [Mammaliicoccus lentus]|uniref:hypothetical protein n=1 Tax=Mammaliicoccus lentus TaxID=42858 RepID=UPI001071DDAC|nr:hypothetical protein [Mammaliicoccus lentus]MBF0750460.1 hypothetical protein [Mammaliicoccus lentus]TFU56504.1 hypothetical protein E4T93_13840 [Mammaliicoccus lentus]
METNKVVLDLDSYNELLLQANKYNELKEKQFDNENTRKSIEDFQTKENNKKYQWSERTRKNLEMRDEVKNIKCEDIRLTSLHELASCEYTRFYTKINGYQKELGQARTKGLTKEKLKDIACSILKYYNEAFETNYDNCYADDKLLGEMVYHPAKD